MKRRTFIHHSGKLLIGFALLDTLACKSTTKSTDLTMLDISSAASGNKMFKLEEMTIAQLQKGYENGNFTISEIVQMYL